MTPQQAFVVALCFGLAISTTTASAASDVATAKDFEKQGASKGLVLLDIYWGRVWHCGKFENAQLRSLAFERVEAPVVIQPSGGDFTVETPGLLTAPKHFVQSAYLIDPGEYQLVGFEIGAAKSGADTGSFKATRTDLVTSGRSRAGSFKVSAGEVVYIGNFGVDCYRDPIPWRYYTKTGRDFEEHLRQYKAAFPFIDPSKVAYRLFETTEFGLPYENQ
jgi:hypothetical protein